MELAPFARQMTGQGDASDLNSQSYPIQALPTMS
jgi:hypothetical protein